MTAGKHGYRIRWILYITALMVALILREITEDQTLLVSTALGAIQTLIYTALVTAWGISVRHRIVQPQIRRLLEYVSGLMLFWFLDRGAKYYALKLFDGVENINRYLWYLYYIPMLLLPAVMLMIACSIRKPEHYRLSKKAVAALLCISALFFTAVITNDLHQLVFDFPADAVVFTDSEYAYGILYYPCLAWMIGCAFAALVVMIKKCRLPGGKKVLWRPLVPMAFCIGYCIAYVSGNITHFGDITIIDCFSLIAILEMAIEVRLIPSNTHYESLFRASNLSAVITDEALRPRYTSRAAVVREAEVMREAVKHSSLTQNGVRLSAYPISGGYSFFEEDVAELYEAIEELDDVRAELKEQYTVAQEVYQTSRKRQSLVEKNRLYNIMQSETKEKVEALRARIEMLRQSDDLSRRRALSVEIALHFAYLKRRNNLLFLKESSGSIRGEELVYCIRESLDNFRLCGAETNFRSDLSLDMAFRSMTRMYDAFEAALEAALNGTREIFVALTQKGSDVRLHIALVCDADLSPLSGIGFAVSDEGDGEWTLKYTVQEGGAPV